MSRIFLSLLFAIVFVNIEAKEILSCTTLPIIKVELEEGALWDLSQITGNHEEKAAYIQCEDSLISETINGVRRWYSFIQDRCRFIREETSSYHSIPDSVCISSAFGIAATPCEIDYTASGETNALFSLCRRGVYSVIGPVNGKIIIPTGDTIRAKVTAEIDWYYEKISPTFETVIPREITDSLIRKEYKTYRWFISGRHIPIAVQRDIREDIPYNHCNEYSMAYIHDFSEEFPTNDEFLNELIGDMLVESSVECLDHTVSINLKSPVALLLNVDLVTPGGVSYHHSEHIIEGRQKLEIPCSGLTPQRYIVVLACQNAIEKRFITIH